MKKLLVLALLGISFIGAKAQAKFLTTTSDTKDVSQQVTQLFKENKIHEAFQLLKSYWPVPDNEIDGMEERTIKSLNLVDERFGKSQGISKVKEETIKDFAIRETYLVKYQYTAIRLIFVYYKNENGWIVNAFKWDDSFNEEFK